MSNIKQIHGRQPDLRDMVLIAGIGQYNAQLAIPYMMMLPRTTDPYAQGVMFIVQGLQRLLNRRGAGLDLDGGMGQETLAALIPFSGPRWYDKSWMQLYGDVLRGEQWKGVERVTRAAELDQIVAPLPGQTEGVDGFVGDMMASPLPWIGAAAALWFGRHHIKRWLRT